MIVIHGDDIYKSLRFLNSIIAKHANWQIMRFNLKFDSFDPTDVFLTDSLFNEKRLIILENFLTAGSKKWFGLEKLFSENNRLELILFENEQLGYSQLKSLPKNAKVFLFRPDLTVFKLFDNLLPGNTKTAFMIFKKVVSKTDPNFLFNLLVWHLRRLIIVKSGAKPDVSNWQFEKYRKIASRFRIDHLIHIYHLLFRLEVKIKKGEVDNLESALSLILFELTKDSK